HAAGATGYSAATHPTGVTMPDEGRPTVMSAKRAVIPAPGTTICGADWPTSHSTAAMTPTSTPVATKPITAATSVAPAARSAAATKSEATEVRDVTRSPARTNSRIKKFLGDR